MCSCNCIRSQLQLLVEEQILYFAICSCTNIYFVWRWKSLWKYSIPVLTQTWILIFAGLRQTKLTWNLSFGYANIFTSIQSHLNLSVTTAISLCYFKVFVCVCVFSPTVCPSSCEMRISAPISPKSSGWNTSHAHPTTSSTRSLRHTEMFSKVVFDTQQCRQMTTNVLRKNILYNQVVW